MEYYKKAMNYKWKKDKYNNIRVRLATLAVEITQKWLPRKLIKLNFTPLKNSIRRVLSLYMFALYLNHIEQI